MNNKIFTAPNIDSLVRVWRSTGQPRTPLVCAWTQANTVQMLPNSAESSMDTRGGLPCA